MSPEERKKYLPPGFNLEEVRQAEQAAKAAARAAFCSDDNVDDLIAKYGGQLKCSIEEFKKMSPEERLKMLPQAALEELKKKE